MLSSRVLYNDVSGGNCGGIAVLRCESGIIKDSNISFNSALSGPLSKNEANGGGLCLELSGQVLVEGSSFEGNDASNQGGAVQLIQATNISVRQCSFLANQATNGGSMSIKESLLVNINDTLLADNIASNNGGGIIVENSVSVNIHESRFVRSQTTRGFGSSIW